MAKLARQNELVGGQERNLLCRETRNGAWLSAILHRLNGTELSQEELCDNLRLKYGLMPQDIPANCDGCGKKFSIDHALSFPKGVLVLAQNEYAEKELGALGSRALAPSAISYKYQINTRTLQGESNRDGVRWEGDTDNGGTVILGEAQGGRKNGRTRNRSDELARTLGEVEVPAESRSELNSHDFWKRGTTTIFDIITANFNAGSYLSMPPKKALEKVEKNKEDVYLQA